MSVDESWQSYRLLADNAIDVVLEATLQTEITWISPSVEEVLGWQPGELIGKSAADIVHPDDIGEVIALAQAIGSGDRVRAARCRMLRKDGGYTNMQLRGRPALDAQGGIVGHIVTMQDTTERDEALRALAVLSEGNRVLARVEDEDDLLQQMCESIVQAGEYPVAWYAGLGDDLTDVPLRRALAGPASAAVEAIGQQWHGTDVSAGPTAAAARSLRPEVRSDDESPAATSWQSAAQVAGLRSSIALPVVVDGQLDGILGVAATEADAFDERTTHLFEILASDLGLGLHRMRSVTALQRQTSRLQGVFDSQLDPFLLAEAIRGDDGSIIDFVYREASTAALDFWERPREAVIGHRMTEIFPDEVASGTFAAYAQTVESGQPLVYDGVPYADARFPGTRHFDVRGVRTGDGISVTFRDVTARFEAARLLAESEERYRLLAENASDLVWQSDGRGRIIWVSDSVRTVLGYEPDEVLGRGLDIIHPDDQSRVREAQGRLALGIPVEGEVRLLKTDGTWLWMAFSAQTAASDDAVTHVITLKDIDAEVRARDALVHAIGHDPLTGMAARPAMVQRIGDALARLPIRRVGVVMCIGVDRLSAINDAYTHAAGDIVLTTIATRIVEAVGNPDYVGRGTGVEFLALIPEAVTGDEAAPISERILKACRGPIPIGDSTVEVTVSIGVAIGDRRTDADQLTRDASAAMGQAKLEGRDRFVFADASLADQARRRLDVERRLREGLGDDRFIPYFQPIVDLATGQMDGYEALVRYIRDDGSIAPPARFMPIAELSPLVADIDLTVLRKSLEALRSIPAPLSVGVNISSVTLTRPGYLSLIEQLLRESDISLSRLHLEVTETALLGELSGVVDAMQAIAALGARWYVDDFGTGFSSISHLRDLPIAGLKLDVSFSHGVREGDTKSIRLAQALAGLAGGLGLDTVAEGIETPQEAQVLLLQGWRHGQGYLYGRPAELG